ncbi:hypothetical protein F4813DRAFT_112827 [Daldinia decipiens]|uniref:uncharacterized protein n=1 Tax=Daldinia decipiens TaxID=326647 RepID=UPI0020C412B3|nr:uncharacterized protein F4813DRAFT_112827 [Daldinia decipiens]KAI1656839.1 hypothetical protein F4813DRAFT_112827 [Daldinia decipiens]
MPKMPKCKTYNTGDSLVVTDPTTGPAVSGLSRGERTGSRVLQILWSYVMVCGVFEGYIPLPKMREGQVTKIETHQFSRPLSNSHRHCSNSQNTAMINQCLSSKNLCPFE